MAERAWAEDFDFYFTKLETAGGAVLPYSISLDLAAARAAPLESHPLRLTLRIEMKAPRPDGLRAQQEAEALFQLEDRLVEHVVSEVGGLFVGHAVGAGQTDLFAYLPANATERRAQLEATARGVSSGYTVELDFQQDADWGFYFDFLYPDTYQHQGMLNRRLLRVFGESGDDTAAARPVDHVAHFFSQTAAEQAAVALRGAGFRTDPVEQKGEEPAAFALNFHREDLPARADEFCEEILDVILPHEGKYDGWGAPLIKRDST